MPQNPPVPNAKISQALSALRAVAAVPAWPSIRGEDVGRSLAEMAQRDLDAALQLLADRAQFITGATGAAIALRRNGMKDMLCRASTGSNAPELGALLSTEFGLSGESVRTKQLLRCDDAERDVRVNRDVCRHLGIASVVVMPVVHDDEVLGVFELFSGKTNAFGERDLSAVQRLGQMVETAVRLAQVTESLPDTLKLDESSIAQAKSEEQILDEHILEVETFRPSLQTKEDSDVLQSAMESATESPRPETVVAASMSEVSATTETAAAHGTAPEVPLAVGTPARASQQTTSVQTVAGAADKLPNPPKPLFWSAADASTNEKPAESDLSHVPAVLRGLRKCEACGFPISETRTLCVECEEKRWRGQLKRPQPMPTGAIPRSDATKSAPQPSPAGQGKERAPALGSTLSTTGAKDSAQPNMRSSAVEANPAFVLTAGLENSQSWISDNKYLFAVLVLVAVLVGAFLFLR